MKLKLKLSHIQFYHHIHHQIMIIQIPFFNVQLMLPKAKIKMVMNLKIEFDIMLSNDEIKSLIKNKKASTV